MPANSENLIAWGECDAAGIVYYPRYFHFMDIAFQNLMRKAGFNHRQLLQEHGVRVPIIDVGAKFLSPASFDDRLIVSADVEHWGTKSFRVAYKGTREGVPVFEGFEVRVWAKIGADGVISTTAIAPQFKAALSAAARQDDTGAA
jgi:YbgC/YbaW family acyl-CoA thioester hydrolase